MFEEKFEEERFSVNRERDKFIEEILNIRGPMPWIDGEEISELFESFKEGFNS